jgi:hypothetical protein
MKCFHKRNINPLLVIAMALLLSLAAWAQQSNSQQNPPADNNASANQTTIRGCLTGAAGTYVLLDKQSGASYTLLGDDTQLGQQIQHEVEVTGQAVSRTQNNSQSAGGATQPPVRSRFKVDSVREISDRCLPPKPSK